MLQAFGTIGLATDSARVSRSTLWARLGIGLLQKLFAAAPMPDLQVPTSQNPFRSALDLSSRLARHPFVRNGL
jgi:hypothetical protein